MRFDVVLNGNISTGEECETIFSVYIDDVSELEKAAHEEGKNAPWLLKIPGWPDVPKDSEVTVKAMSVLDNSPKQVDNGMPDIFKQMLARVVPVAVLYLLTFLKC